MTWTCGLKTQLFWVSATGLAGADQALPDLTFLSCTTTSLTSPLGPTTTSASLRGPPQVSLSLVGSTVFIGTVPLKMTLPLIVPPSVTVAAYDRAVAKDDGFTVPVAVLRAELDGRHQVRAGREHRGHAE